MHGAFLARRERHPQRSHDALRDFVLHRENIVQRPIVALRPKRKACLRIDQLDSNPQPLAGFPDAPIEKRADAELPRRRAAVHLSIAKTKRGGARSGPQSIHAAERVDNLLRDSVTEVGLVGLRAQVG